jgi:microcystin-dependent protein
MSTPFIGEIRLFGGSFAPLGWALCDGQLLAIAQNEALFSLIGTTYGGDGQTTFALPDLRGRLPVHQGNGYVLGQSGGAEQVTLASSQMPAHSHPPQAAAAGTSTTPGGNVWADSAALQFAPAASALAPMASTPSQIGGGQPHENTSPFVAISFIIALEGIYPPQG